MAMAYAALGDKDKAFGMLDRTYEISDSYLSFIRTELRFNPLLSDTRFKALLRKLTLKTRG